MTPGKNKKRALLAPISQQPKFNLLGDPENIVAEDGAGIAVAKADEYDFDILTKPQTSRWVKTTDFWEDDEWDFNQYDLVVLYPQIPPFYAGLCQPKVVKYVKALINYEGPIVFHHHDPIHRRTNFLERVHYRLYELESKVKWLDDFNPYDISAEDLKSNWHKTDQAEQPAWTIWPNKDGVSQPLCDPVDVEFVDSLRETFKTVRQQTLSLQREEGICYVGAKRPERIKRLKDLGIIEDDIHFLGPISGKGRATKISAANQWMRGFTHTLILGDEGHSNMGLNHRLLQGLAAGCICMIDEKLDPHKTLIKDPVLQKVLYFSGDDIVANYLFTLHRIDDIINRQNAELRRIFDESIPQLIERTTSEWLQNT